MEALNSKPRIAWFTTQGERSRSWYLWQNIGPALRERFHVVLYGATTNRAEGIETYLSSYAAHRKNPYDLFVYNLEDTVDSYFSRFALGLIPGVVLFHDFLLLTDGPEPIHNSAWEMICRSYVDGTSWPIRNTSHERHGPWASRESAYALGGLFFSPWAHQEWFSKGREGLIAPRPSSSIWYPASLKDRQPQGDRFVAFAGRPAVEDRAVAVLRAVKKSGVQLRWLLNADEVTKARELIKDERVTSLVSLIEGRFPSAWQVLTSQAIAALHPRMSVYGDTGPYLEISLASGAPVVVSDFGRSSYLPNETVLKISPGVSEDVQLAMIIQSLSEHPQITNTPGINFACENILPTVVAGEISSFIERVLPISKPFLSRWQGFEERARNDLLEESWQGWNFSDPLVRTALQAPFDELFKST